VVLEVGYFSGDLSARIVSLVQDANEAKRQWQVEEARIRKDEERLTQEHLEVVTRLKRVTDVEQRKQLQRKLDEIITQEDVWTWLNRTSFYAESLGLDISVALSDRLEEVNHGFARNKHQLIIPYGYSQEVEHEHFLRVVTCDVNIPYLPPRYLDAAEMVPSGKDGVP